MAGLRSRQEALRRMLEEQGITDKLDPQVQSVGNAFDAQGIGDVGMAQVTGRIDENGVESQWLDDEQLAAQERQDIEDGVVPATLQASLDQTAEIPEAFRDPTFTRPEPRMSLAVGDPTITGRKAHPAPKEYAMGTGAPTPESRPFKSLLEADKPVERADASYRVSGDVAKPQGPMPVKSVGEPEPSPEERMRLAMEMAQKEADRNEGWAMIQRGGDTIGGAFGGGPVDEEFHKNYRASAMRPVERLKESQAIERKGVSERADRDEKKAERDRKVEEFVLEQQAKKDAGAAKMLEENRRRDEDRGFKVGDEDSRRQYETSRDARQNAAARERARIMATMKGDEREDLLQVPGYTRGADAPGIKPEEAASMRDLTAADSELKAAMSEMEKAKNKTGREFLPGADKDTQSGAQASMLLALKGLAKTGALDEQTERVARGLIPGPGDGPEASAAKLKQLKSLVESKAGGYAKSRGYTQTDGGRQKSVNGGYDLGGGLPPDKKARLEELRRKRDAGALK